MTLANWCSTLLDAARFDDYCPNGLQVEGRKPIQRLISGVTASRNLIEAAITAQADAILVHHGFFWRGEEPSITGMKAARLRLLFEHDISLLAYHLPLDAHPLLGNNAQLAQRLGLINATATTAGRGLLWQCELPTPISAAELATRISIALDRAPLLIGDASTMLQRIGWCTGAAQHFIDEAAALGLDAYISGEISEQTVHAARELSIHYFAAGHHATERYGVQALGAAIAQEFGITHQFIEDSNPV